MSTVKYYYTSASSDLAIKKRQQGLQFLLDKKNVKYTAIDMSQLEKPARDAVYDAAGTRSLPLVFLDDTMHSKFIGDYDALVLLNEDGLLESTLKPQQ